MTSEMTSGVPFYSYRRRRKAGESSGRAVSYKESPEAAHRTCTHTFEIAQRRRCEALATAFPAVFEALFDGDLATYGKLARSV